MIKEKMESTFNYKEGNGKNFIYSYYKISSDGQYYHLWCKDQIAQELQNLLFNQKILL